MSDMSVNGAGSNPAASQGNGPSNAVDDAAAQAAEEARRLQEAAEAAARAGEEARRAAEDAARQNDLARAAQLEQKATQKDFEASQLRAEARAVQAGVPEQDLKQVFGSSFVPAPPPRRTTGEIPLAQLQSDAPTLSVNQVAASQSGPTLDAAADAIANKVNPRLRQMDPELAERLLHMDASDVFKGAPAKDGTQVFFQNFSVPGGDRSRPDAQVYAYKRNGEWRTFEVAGNFAHAYNEREARAGTNSSLGLPVSGREVMSGGPYAGKPYQRFENGALVDLGGGKLQRLAADGSAVGKPWVDPKPVSLEKAVPLADLGTLPSAGKPRAPAGPAQTGGTGAVSSSPIPGAEQAIQYALNPPPNPNPGSGGDWHYWCLGLVNRAYASAGRSIGNLSAETAHQSYERYQSQGQIHTDGTPPRGAVVFFDWKQSNGENIGHVGISLGDGTYVGTATSGAPTVVRSVKSPSYLGWAYPSASDAKSASAAQVGSGTSAQSAGQTAAAAGTDEGAAIEKAKAVLGQGTPTEADLKSAYREVLDAAGGPPRSDAAKQTLSLLVDGITNARLAGGEGMGASRLQSVVTASNKLQAAIRSDAPTGRLALPSLLGGSGTSGATSGSADPTKKDTLAFDAKQSDGIPEDTRSAAEKEAAFATGGRIFHDLSNKDPKYRAALIAALARNGKLDQLVVDSNGGYFAKDASGQYVTGTEVQRGAIVNALRDGVTYGTVDDALFQSKEAASRPDAGWKTVETLVKDGSPPVDLALLSTVADMTRDVSQAKSDVDKANSQLAEELAGFGPALSPAQQQAYAAAFRKDHPEYAKLEAVSAEMGALLDDDGNRAKLEDLVAKDPSYSQLVFDAVSVASKTAGGAKGAVKLISDAYKRLKSVGKNGFEGKDFTGLLNDAIPLVAATLGAENPDVQQAVTQFQALLKPIVDEQKNVPKVGEAFKDLGDYLATPKHYDETHTFPVEKFAKDFANADGLTRSLKVAGIIFGAQAAADSGSSKGVFDPSTIKAIAGTSKDTLELFSGAASAVADVARQNAALASGEAEETAKRLAEQTGKEAVKDFPKAARYAANLVPVLGTVASAAGLFADASDALKSPSPGKVVKIFGDVISTVGSIGAAFPVTEPLGEAVTTLGDVISAGGDVIDALSGNDQLKADRKKYLETVPGLVTDHYGNLDGDLENTLLNARPANTAALKQMGFTPGQILELARSRPELIEDRGGGYPLDGLARLAKAYDLSPERTLALLDQVDRGSDFPGQQLTPFLRELRRNLLEGNSLSRSQARARLQSDLAQNDPNVRTAMGRGLRNALAYLDPVSQPGPRHGPTPSPV